MPGQQVVGAGAAGTDRPAAAGEALVLDQRLITACAPCCPTSRWIRRWSRKCSLPGEAYLRNQRSGRCGGHPRAREFARQQLAEQLFEALWLRYQANRECRSKTRTWPRPSTSPACAAEHCAVVPDAQRQAEVGGDPGQFDTSDNMTERLTALAVLVNSPFEAEKAKALETFAEHFKDNPLVMDQWFSVQAAVPCRAGWRGSRR
jgi:aminopeptidase N